MRCRRNFFKKNRRNGVLIRFQIKLTTWQSHRRHLRFYYFQKFIVKFFIFIHRIDLTQAYSGQGRSILGPSHNMVLGLFRCRDCSILYVTMKY